MLIHFLIVVVLFHHVCAVHFCILAGEQRTSRAAGNQSRGFPDSEARRRVREHVAVAAADQRWRQLTEELESPRRLSTPPYPLQPPLLCTVCTVFYHIPLHPSPYRFSQPSAPFSRTVCSTELQSCIPVWWFRHKQCVHTHICLFFVVVVVVVGTSVMLANFASMHESVVPARF